MDDLKLIELIRDITCKNIPYCLVCFRLESDRRLVRPKAVAEFLRTTSTPKFARDKWVCHICERQAERAMRLFRTMRIARDVSMAMWNLADKNYSSERVLQVLPVHLSINSNRRKEVSPEKLMETIRRHGHLAQTNVLVVNTQGIVEVDSMSTDNDKPIPSPDMIVLDDDEDIKITDTPKLVPIEKLLEAPAAATLPTPAANTQTQTLLIQPENSPNVYLCTLPVNFPQIPIPTVVHNNTLVIDPNPQLTTVSKPETSNYINIAPKFQNKVTLPTKLNVGTQPNLGTQPNVGTQLNAAQLNVGTKLNVGTQLNVGTRLNAPQLNVDKLNVSTKCGNVESNMSKTIVEDKDGNICMIENPVSLKETVDVTDDGPKEPSEPREPGPGPKMAVMDSSSRIDWEDKIPMDVISYMDANDPNAHNMLDGMTVVTDRTRQTNNSLARKRRVQGDVINVD